MSTMTGSIECFVRAGFQVLVTQHARERARERLHWSASTIVRMAQRALECGLASGSTTGQLRFFLFNKESVDRHSCPYLYGENIYMFALNATAERIVLLTIYRAPRQLLRSLVNRSECSGANVVHGQN